MTSTAAFAPPDMSESSDSEIPRWWLHVLRAIALLFVVSGVGARSELTSASQVYSRPDASLKVEDVAQRVAYADPANFTRAFRKWTGVTPSAFRARLEMQRD